MLFIILFSAVLPLSATANEEENTGLIAVCSDGTWKVKIKGDWDKITVLGVIKAKASYYSPGAMWTLRRSNLNKVINLPGIIFHEPRTYDLDITEASQREIEDFYRSKSGDWFPSQAKSKFVIKSLNTPVFEVSECSKRKLPPASANTKEHPKTLQPAPPKIHKTAPEPSISDRLINVLIDFNLYRIVIIVLLSLFAIRFVIKSVYKYLKNADPVWIGTMASITIAILTFITFLLTLFKLAKII